MNRNFTRVIGLLVVTMVVGEVRAQQDPHYSQFMFNKLTYNPGFAGATGGKMCVTLLNRTQWMGFSSKGTQIAGQQGLYQGDAPTDLVGSFNVALTGDAQKYPILSRIGLGLTFSKDQLGFATTVMPKFALSYGQPISDGMLRFGVGVGVMQQSLDGSKLKFIDPGDPLIPTSNVQSSATDIDAGLYYTKPNLGRFFEQFYAGLSVTHVNQSKLKYDWTTPTAGGVEVDNKMHYYFITGAEYQLPIPSLRLQPNIIIKKDPAKIQADINCYLMWNQNIRGGLSWRPMDAVVVLVGYQFEKDLYIGAAYD